MSTTLSVLTAPPTTKDAAPGSSFAEICHLYYDLDNAPRDPLKLWAEGSTLAVETHEGGCFNLLLFSSCEKTPAPACLSRPDFVVAEAPLFLGVLVVHLLKSGLGSLPNSKFKIAEWREEEPVRSSSLSRTSQIRIGFATNTLVVLERTSRLYFNAVPKWNETFPVISTDRLPEPDTRKSGIHVHPEISSYKFLVSGKCRRPENVTQWQCDNRAAAAKIIQRQSYGNSGNGKAATFTVPLDILEASFMEAEKLILVGFLKGRNSDSEQYGKECWQLSKYLLKDAEERLRNRTRSQWWTFLGPNNRGASALPFVSTQKDSDEFGERREVSIAEMFDPRASQNYEGLVWNHTHIHD
ncbi:hypothetical protein B0H14DRAFT_2603885 [Mycena olivaceomarginata]|nr:hypothetical protein B0H14DRAFT_2603885 [Mycena olivaceomarginata]